MGHFGLLTLSLVICSISQAASEVYYITTQCISDTEWPCLTLTQFATNLNNHAQSTMTLIFLPGKHYLRRVKLALTNVDYLVMKSENSTAEIQCTSNSHIYIYQSQYIHITNLEFIGCGGNQVKHVREFLVKNSEFKGHDGSGTALELIETKAQIINSTFVSNRNGTFRKSMCHHEFGCTFRAIGGAIISTNSTLDISQSRFEGNCASYCGAIFAEHHSIINMNRNAFIYNSGIEGILCSFHTTKIIMKENEFYRNGVSLSGGVLYSEESTVIIESSTFRKNNAFERGGVVYCKKSTITIRASEFYDNSPLVVRFGGVLYSTFSNITIEESKFHHSTALYGGVLNFIRSRIEIKKCIFHDNNALYLGGALYSQTSIVTINDSNFTQNTSPEGAVIHASGSSIKHHNYLLYDSNSVLVYGVITLYQSELNQYNSNTSMTFSNNYGSLMSIDSNITLCGQATFLNNTQLQTATDGFQEGGAITLFQSNVNFDGVTHFVHNSAENGGAIYSTASKLYVNGNVTIAHNAAVRNGGGVYLSKSELNCHQTSTLKLINNEAWHKGGGLHAISSSINAASSTLPFLQQSQLNTTYTGARITFKENDAEKGGGIALEANAKLYILKYSMMYDEDNVDTTVFSFIANRADYGGAVYVDDYTNPGTCSRDTRSECPFQVLAVYGHRPIDRQPNIKTQCVYFSQNYAYISGFTLYGGLLGRCAVSPFAEVNYKYQHLKDYGDGNAYFKNVSTIDYTQRVPQELSGATNLSISSLPVRVCLCTSNEHDVNNCNDRKNVKIKKGHQFTLSVVAVDQVGQPVDAIIQAALRFTKRAKSGLDEGQLTRDIQAECTNLTFNVVSSQDSEILTLYALDGPCKDDELSETIVEIRFVPCDCPIGLQVSGINSTNCTCECDSGIEQHMEQCDNNGSLIKEPQSRAWISYINHTDKTGYLVYDNCPFDYCLLTSPPFYLDQPSGADAQCAFRRSSLLCGSCQYDLSLSLGSSRCLSCPSYWYAVFLAITTAAIIAGIALVALLLVLNITVATGTLNGLIFYSNVVYANKSILLPFKNNNFITVFVSWMNLELGIDTCYFPAMDTYIRTWLQLAFPAYVILLVVTVIIISSKSTKFSDVIGKKDPVATLATLVLLSYTKLLEICFKSLSGAVLQYPDGSSQMRWLPDGTVIYLFGKHIPLFLVAIVILLICLVYAVLLFSWQWLLYLPRWRILRWSRNPKVQTFIETYHKPYTPKHRYWTGLLLIVRIVLHLAASTNLSNNPRIALLAIGFAVCFIHALRNLAGSRLYRKWAVDILETFIYLNILSFVLFMWYTLDGRDSNKEAVAYTSVSMSLILLLLVILYHVYTYTTLFSKLKRLKLCTCTAVDQLFADTIPEQSSRLLHLSPPPDDDIHRFNELLDIIDGPVNTYDYSIPLNQSTVKPTQSVVEVHHPKQVPLDSEEVVDTQHTPGAPEAVQVEMMREAIGQL